MDDMVQIEHRLGMHALPAATVGTFVAILIVGLRWSVSSTITAGRSPFRSMK
jgi:hypothetical protein